jgi:hypothetical protein
MRVTRRAAAGDEMAITTSEQRNPAARGPKPPLQTEFADTLAALAGPPEGSTPPPEVPSGGSRFAPGKVLGEGGMGRVLEAEDRQFGRRVALKELLGHGSNDERRFVVEALITGNLEHPGIPAVYERGTHDGRTFYAMQKLDGRPFSELLAGPLSLAARVALVPIVIRVAHTLGFAHARGIVHRDVKPENVMVGQHGEVWLVDWGIAKVRGRGEAGGAAVIAEPIAGPQTATVNGSVLGTPAYMAPEQANGQIDRIDERTDVFALGAMLFHVLSGRPPYTAATSIAMVMAAADVARPPLASLAADAPPELVAIVERAMAREPEARFADAFTLATALEGALAHAAVAKPSAAMRALGVVASVAALGIALLATFGTMSSTSSFAEQGPFSYVVTFTAFVGLGLAVADWRTRGAHALLPLSAGLAGFTCATGLAGAAAALGQVARYALQDAPREDWPQIVLGGLWEGVGIAATAGALAAVQAVVLGVVLRARRLAELDRAP